MKKEYVKPLVIVENFLMSSSIAASCSNTGDTFSTAENCAANYNIDAILGAIGDLELGVGQETIINLGNEIVKVCYHSSTGVNIFGS